jgi:uncharacterized Zn-finger protein
MADVGLIFLRGKSDFHQDFATGESEMSETAEKTRSAGSAIEVTRADLPLSCPRPQDELWNMHPRVYLPIEETGEAVCPYCGARYVLSKS